MDHFYQNITGWAAFEDLYRQAVRSALPTQPAKFVEVGSWLGRSAALMAVEIINSGKPISFACIDPWEDGGPDLRDTDHYKKLPKPPYAMFKENIKPVAHVITPMRMSSVLASAFFEDKSVDFLMLDGDHSYEAVKLDIECWLPKMRPGSLLSGDDYLWPGVKQAVGEAFDPRVVQTRIKRPIPEGVKDGYLKSASYWWVQL